MWFSVIVIDVAAPGHSAHHPDITPGRVTRGDRDNSAEVVRSPACYWDDKRGTTLQTLPDLLTGHQGARLTAQAAGTRIDGPRALPISNGPYEMSDIAGRGRHARLEAGPGRRSPSG